eukprot:Nitzschia sp. Nitz4//scaffold31_size150131//86496//89386//NITZ4_002837-RA/size150131-augustus-gene-0.19-mRNA-1//-1//CDS//3329547686//6427//frame0
MDGSEPPVNEAQDFALRFEDLTVDDDLPLTDRITRYCRSGIALQRLVHVKMLAETAETVGTSATLTTIVPLLHSLVEDQESVIRQHLASQLLPVSLVSMVRNVGQGKQYKVAQMLEDKSLPKVYDPEGYQVVTTAIVGYLQTLVTDPDVDVRRSASDTLAGLAFHIRNEDVARCILPIPLKLAQQQPLKQAKKKPDEPEGFVEELRITSANLLAELGGAAENRSIPPELVRDVILPAVLALCNDPGFRVRRAAAQALPRVLGGTSVEEARTKILPAFEDLSRDEVYRVRKSTGECLVDMSRSMMILAAKDPNPKAVNALRRNTLIPIAENLLADANRFVRHGMMQFLGPFLASFYPFVDSALHTILPGSSESDGSNHSGIVAQFFPHASSMVSRLNSSAAATTSAPTPTLADLNVHNEIPLIKELQQTLPAFVHAGRSSSVSLKAVVAHRRNHAPDPEDVAAVMGKLLDQFTGLARISTGEEGTDAEMRVYCAYSYPAVVLLLGPENWQGRLKDCFTALLNPNYGSTDTKEPGVPPLPVKRCLASSLHTVAHILGPAITASDIMPIFRDNFMRDTDESVRLNMIRNFPTLLSLLPSELRSQYLLQWCETIRGEEVLGALKRSATNPLVLNWRQRDYVSRSLPDLMGMADAVFVHTYLWPLLKTVLSDTISLVREDAIWGIPILLKCFAPENVVVNVEGGDKGKAEELWSQAACKEVVTWLKDNILKPPPSKRTQSNGKTSGRFSQRQLYCEICAAIALALRFGDGYRDPQDPVSDLETKFKSQLSTKDPNTSIGEYGPYRKVTRAERAHLVGLLSRDILPTALELKDDRVVNVRLSLRKALHLMPDDMTRVPAFKDALQCLEEEVETWESFSGLAEPIAPTPVQPIRNMGPNVMAGGVGVDEVGDKRQIKKKHKKEKRKGHDEYEGESTSMAHI